MPTKKATVTAPLTFELPLSLIARIAARQKRLGMRSASEVVRAALANFDIDRSAIATEPRRQISVRLPAGTRGGLVKAARRKKTSIGTLLRLALESFASKPAKKR
jgi:Arc/MetJ-type ribon-helix-helix transcriptional regulator